MTPAPVAVPPSWPGNAPVYGGGENKRRPNPLIIFLSVALVVTMLLCTTYIVWDRFLTAEETPTTMALPSPSPGVAAQASPSPEASPTPLPSPSPSPKPSPSPAASPSPSPLPSPSPPSRAPAGAAPDGWLTFVVHVESAVAVEERRREARKGWRRAFAPPAPPPPVPDVFLQARPVEGLLALECIGDAEFEGVTDLTTRQLDTLVALGYAGWGPHQLEDELAAGAWVVVEPDDALLFDEKTDTKWQRAFDRRGIDL